MTLPSPCRSWCTNYDVCGGTNPAVVEVVEDYRWVGHHERHVMINRYCVPCFSLDMQDMGTLRRSARLHGRSPRVYSGAVNGRSRKTWLTTMVNGEVPA